MRRGTTATLTFALPAALSVAALYITFEQRGKIVLEKTLDDVTIDGETVTLELSQEDTLSLKANRACHIQMRARDESGAAYVSQVMRADVHECLKEGVI